MSILLLAAIVGATPRVSTQFSGVVEVGSVARWSLELPWPSKTPCVGTTCEQLQARVFGSGGQAAFVDLAVATVVKPIDLVSGKCRRGRGRRRCSPRVKVELPILVKANARAGRAQARATLVLRNGSSTLGRYPLKRRLRIIPPKIETSQLAGWVKAYRDWFAQAERSTGPAKRMAEVEKLAIRARLRAAVAALASSQSVESLATVETHRIELQASASVQNTVRQTLSEVEAMLRNYRFEVAEKRLRALQATPVSTPKELARVLLLQGMVELFSQRKNSGLRSVGQALCLNPRLVMPDIPQVLQAKLQPLVAKNVCSEPLRLSMVDAVLGPEAAYFDVSTQLSSDPYQLVERVRISWIPDFGRPEQVVAEVEKGSAVARFPVPVRPGSDTVLLRAEAFDQVGHRVAALGEPEPVRMVVSGLAKDEGFDVPDWVWWLTGAVVLTGAAVAGGVYLATQDDEPDRGIGPIFIEF